MKRVPYQYDPIYNAHDARSQSEKTFDIGSGMLIWLGIALGCWFASYILLLWIPDTVWLYWPIKIIGIIGKWGLIIGGILWIIVEIIGLIQQSKEHRKALKEAKKHIPPLCNQEEQ